MCRGRWFCYWATSIVHAELCLDPLCLRGLINTRFVSFDSISLFFDVFCVHANLQLYLQRKVRLPNISVVFLFLRLKAAAPSFFKQHICLVMSLSALI